jgi:hypothetical protein
MAGGSARLGAALLPAAPGLAPQADTTLAAPAAPRLLAEPAHAIDHVPLPA